jgi:hypothetical protein
MALFIINTLFNKNKSFVVNWFKWLKNCNTFLEVPSKINENVRNTLFHFEVQLGCQKIVTSGTSYSD